MSEENIENVTTSDNTFASTLVNSYILSHAKFGGNCLVNSNIPVLRIIKNLKIYFLRTRCIKCTFTIFITRQKLG